MDGSDSQHGSSNGLSGASNGTQSTAAAKPAGITPEFVQRIADDNGFKPEHIENLARHAISSSIDIHLREVISNAMRVMCHSRRFAMTSKDIDAALVNMKISPRFGFSTNRELPLRYAASGGRELLVDDSEDLPLAPIVTALPGKLPAPPIVKVHWLAIEGEQPAIPENPVPSDLTTPLFSKHATSQTDSLDATTAGGDFGMTKIADSGFQQQTITTHQLTLEQQVFYKEITEAIIGSDDEKREEALQCIKFDEGLQSLVPRFSLFIAEGVRSNIAKGNIAHLVALLRMLQCLLQNPHVDLEKNVHELLPSILSCLLGKHVAGVEFERQFNLRMFSATLLAGICSHHISLSLHTRVGIVLSRAIANCEPGFVSSVFGAVSATRELGIESIRIILMPHASYLSRRLASDGFKPEEASVVDKLKAFVVKLFVEYVRWHPSPDLRTLEDYKDIFGGFGEAVYRKCIG